MIFVRPERDLGNKNQEVSGNFSSRLYEPFQHFIVTFPKGSGSLQL
jgi:hypothetical protein